MSELKCGKFWLCLRIGQATPTKTRFSLCYKSLQRTVSHLKMCLLKDMFYSRMQESGESYDHYQTALRQLVERFEFESITPNQILRDKLVFGIHNSKVCVRLLREKNLSLEKTDEICRSHETMVQQMRVVGDAGLRVADAGNGMLCLKSLKEGNVGPVVAQEMLTRGQIVVNFADVSMT